MSGVIPDFGHYQLLMNMSSLVDVAMATNRHGDTVLHVAARHGHLPVIRHIHEKLGAGLTHVNLDGKSALHEAAQHGHVECAEYLLKAGCHVDCLKKADWSAFSIKKSTSNVIYSSPIDHFFVLIWYF